VGGWDHGTQAVSDSLVQALGLKNGFDVDTTNVSEGFFTDEKLSAYKAVCFINTTGKLLTDSQKVAFQRFIAKGNGFVGMYSCADAEYSWKWYHQLLGAYFVGESYSFGKIAILDHNNPSTQFITPDTISRTDQWYYFANSPYDSTIDPAKEKNLTVLMSLVESSLGITQPKFHPLCWCQEFGGGRAWYTMFGHFPEFFSSDSIYQKNLLGGILWATGMSSTPVISHRSTFRPLVVPSVPVAVYDLTGRKIQAFGPVGNSAAGRDDFEKSVSSGAYYSRISGRPGSIHTYLKGD
jgi:type 1 glutamine amidotransferase